MRIAALDKKLLRDLWAMRGQALAIAMVVAAGVAMYVMYLSNFASLRQSQRTYYEQQRFADVFVSLKRAPLSVARELAALPGVAALEARVVADVTLDLPNLDAPAAGRLVSLPRGRRPRVNEPLLRRGSWPEPGAPDQVLASESFFEAHALELGARIPAVINGRLRQLTVVGVALSPEYVYSIQPGEIVPDPKRFGVFWMDERALAAAFDMEGAFNDLALALERGASEGDIIAALDRRLEAYGGLGAIPRALQLSHWTVESELRQLQSIGVLLPLIFLVVAAFILNVALTRALSLERSQIACLQALGYGKAAIGWHYLKWALAIGLLGAALGLGGGAALGNQLIQLYNDFFRFPELHFSVPLEVATGAVALTLGAAGAGAFGSVRRALRIPPAEAMRPEAPARYRRSWLETVGLARLGIAGRMVLRNLTRRPLRAAASIFGISFAVAILMVGLVFSSAIERLIQTQFWDAERQDVTVSFREPHAAAVLYTLVRLPGVIAVEPQRSVAARLRAGHRQRYLALTGVPQQPRLQRIVDRDGNALRMPPSGLLLSRMLAGVLGVAPGDSLTIEVLEGQRPVLRAQVMGLVDDVLGLSAYMDAGALHQLMREDEVASGALLSVDSRFEPLLAAELKRTPSVAGAAFKRAVLTTFRETLSANMNLTIFINVVFASIIAVGVVYNAARISLSERSRELASLRVLGFTRAEISVILLGELALLTLLALPLGGLFGYGLSAALVRSVDSEVYRFPLYISRQAVAQAFVGVTLAAAMSGLVVRRKLDRLDLVAVLKGRE